VQVLALQVLLLVVQVRAREEGVIFYSQLLEFFAS
jgi:hypothetical protein